MKPGDKVRYLNAVGGGVVTRIDGKIAYVEEDGFETPILVKDLVVVMPAGFEGAHKNANIMFDQGAFDQGKKSEPVAPKVNKDITPVAQPKPVTEAPVVETPHGNALSVALVFEPEDIKKLSSTRFTAILVNDSNYFLTFSFLRKGNDDKEWTCVYTDTVAPNESMDLATYGHEDLNSIERVALQGFAFRKDRQFEMKPVINVMKKLNLSKFYKLHCFRPGTYFDSDVIEIPLVTDDAISAPVAVEAERIREAMVVPGTPKEGKETVKDLKDLKKATAKNNPEANPHKLLPLIEVDLHIGNLLDTTAGLSNSDMLDVQIGAVRKTMEKHSRRIGQKIVFIHGKGDGVLRKAVLQFLKKNYPKAELQDASFREYGFGATLVTIH